MSEHILPAVWLSAIPLERVGSESLPEQPCPLSQEVLDSLQHRVPWVISNIIRGEIPEVTNLIQPSDDHGRSAVADLTILASAEKPTMPSSEPRAIWPDEYGNPYSSMSYKGNFGQNITIHAGTFDPEGIRFMGLQTTYALERCLKASRLLRSHGVDTEHITGAYIPTELPHRQQVITMQHLKQGLLIESAMASALSSEDPSTPQHERRADNTLSKDELESLQISLTESEFVVTMRTMLRSERLGDFVEQDKATLCAMLDDAIRLETILGNFKPEGATTQQQKYQEYVTKFLPSQLGTHIRTMHDLGLAHRMLHPGNITTTGGIIDLDSVIGPAIGLNEKDTQVMAADFIEDFAHYLLGKSGPGSNLRRDVLGPLASAGIILDLSASHLEFMKNLYLAYNKDRPEAALSPSGRVDNVMLLSLMARSSAPELTNNSWLLQDITAKLTVEALDANAKYTARDTTAFERFTSAGHFVEDLSTKVVRWLSEEDGRPLYNFMRTFADVATAEELERAARRLYSTRKGEESTKTDAGTHYTTMHECLVEAYENNVHGSSAAAVASIPGAEHTRVGGWDMQIVSTPDLETALQRLSDLSFNFTEVSVRKHVPGSWHKRSDDDTLLHASALLTNTPIDNVKANLVSLHADNIRHEAPGLLHQKNHPASSFGGVRAFREIRERDENNATTEVFMYDDEPAIDIAPGQFYISVCERDGNLTLSVDTCDDLELVKKHLQANHLDELPLKFSETEAPKNAMEAFMWDWGDES